MSPRRGNGLAFLTDRAAFVRRFVLAEVLAPPRGKTMRFGRGPLGAPPAPPVADAAGKKPG